MQLDDLNKCVSQCCLGLKNSVNCDVWMSMEVLSEGKNLEELYHKLLIEITVVAKIIQRDNNIPGASDVKTLVLRVEAILGLQYSGNAPET